MIDTFDRLGVMLKATRRMLLNVIRHDEGDVPGWVLITLMTAALVVVIWTIAGPALSKVFEDAIAKVSGF
jgi:hypothetical protein